VRFHASPPHPPAPRLAQTGSVSRVAARGVHRTQPVRAFVPWPRHYDALCGLLHPQHAGYPTCRSPSPGRLGWRSPQRRTRTATAQPQHVPPDLNLGLRCVVPPYPARWPSMLLLFVGSQFCSPASFPRSVALPQLPSARTCHTLSGRIRRFTYRGLEPHEFAPMLGVHKSLHLTFFRYAPKCR